MAAGVRPEVRGLVVRSHSAHPVGGGVGRVSVLVHGLGMSHRSFARLARRLATSSAVVSLDLPGYGRIGRPHGKVPVERMAAAIAAALDALGLRRAVVVGQSLGTQWAAELAVQRPDLVAALVLIGPVVDDERRTLRAQLLDLARDTLQEPPWMNALVLLDYALCGPTWFVRQVRAMLRYRIDDALRATDRPVLIIRGGRDSIARDEWCRRLRAVPARASLVTVPAASHHTQQHAPSAVASAVRAFTSQF